MGVTGAVCFEADEELSPASLLMIERRSMFAILGLPTPDQARLATGYEKVESFFKGSFI
jgi:hypothetical protein